MSKGFKKFREFREEWGDDEWGENEDRHSRNKEKRLKNRRDKKRMKHQEKFSSFDEEN